MPVHAPLAPPAIAAALLILLAGCSPSPSGTPSPSPTAATPAPTEQAPQESPSPEPEEPRSVPLSIPCDALVSAEAMYSFNPNYALLDEAVPAPGSAAEQIAADAGTVCQWQNLSSGTTITVAVASLNPEALVETQNATFESSEMVPTYGGEGYFSARDGIGEAIVFERGYWIASSSEEYFEPGDAVQIMEAAKSALP